MPAYCSLSLFVYSVYGGQPQGPSLLHTGEQVTKLLLGPTALSSIQKHKLASSMQSESTQRLLPSPPAAARAGCLCFVGPPLL